MNKYLALIIGLFLLSCEWPFDTAPSDDNLYFTVSVSHEITRIVDSAAVEISWTEVTIEDFSKFIIERKSELDTNWTLRATIPNPAVSFYMDMVNDDITFFYRVGISDINGNTRWNESSITIPITTKLYVPADYENIQHAYSTPITDDGDSIIVSPGEYVGSLGLLGKNVVVKSTHGFTSTSIIADGFSRCVNINKGVLQGFLITGGAPMGASTVGGGVYASGSAVLKNNCISENMAPGQGGGAYITGGASLYNNVFHNNSGALVGGLIIDKGFGEIINNTIVDNLFAGVIIDKASSVLFVNNIIAIHDSFDIYIEGSSDATIMYSRFKESSNQDTAGNISENPIFVPAGFIPCLDYQLSDLSPCVNAGHPDIQYNDIDGTQNDMGAFGGPGNNE
ncbi:MAG: right-handed parallel beta-helix repeat-containing protein [Candidatus Marinimicrobia bacterium]|nr:right-handed parallel beta-helix repeat-containing protein [Candidatus Neomarinimicrobiota bacterium]